ncbi:MAG: hypothetical protein NUV91_08585 [Candidatus Omnitrophica bacterium]|nr:hypothetical protein [Candidatus Omnitrophota bacterium]
MQTNQKKGQTVIEYLLILAVVAVVVLLGFVTYVPRSQKISGEFFNKAANFIMDKPPALDARGAQRNYP